MAKELASLYVVLGLNTSEYSKKMKAAQREIKAFATEMTVIGGAITAAFGIAIKQWSDAGDAIAKASKRTGIGAEAMSELKYAADMSGTSIEAVETATKNMARVLQAASEGTKTAVDSLKNLGLTYDNLSTLNVEQKFLKIAEAIAEVRDDSQRTALAMELFGKSGTDLLPMLAEGKTGLSNLRQEARDLGVVFSQESAEAAEQFGDAMARLKTSGEGLRNEIVTGVVPAITPLIDRTTSLVKIFSSWSKTNPEIVSALSQMTLGIGVFSTAIGGTLLMLPKLMSGLNALSRFTKLGLGATAGVGAAGALGAGLLTYGVSEAMRYRQMREDWKDEQWRIQELSNEREKYNRGQINNLKELAAQWENVSESAAWYMNWFREQEISQLEANLKLTESQDDLNKSKGYLIDTEIDTADVMAKVNDVLFNQSKIAAATTNQINDLIRAQQQLSASGQFVTANGKLVSYGAENMPVSTGHLSAIGASIAQGKTMEDLIAMYGLEQMGALVGAGYVSDTVNQAPVNANITINLDGEKVADSVSVRLGQKTNSNQQLGGS